jgi:hypothetical protein
VHGVPKLSSDGAWGVAKRRQSQAAPVALSPQQGAPVVQPNKSGGTTAGTVVHYADPADIFRLDPSSTTPPDTLYGFMQTTGTHSNLLSRPMLTVGSQNLNLADALNVAHAGALLGAISSFPAIQNCLNFLSSELQPIKNQLSNPSLSTTQNLYLKDPVRKTPIPLISTSIADVNLYFYQKGEDLTKKADPPNVVITLGSPTPPAALIFARCESPSHRLGHPRAAKHARDLVPGRLPRRLRHRAFVPRPADRIRFAARCSGHSLHRAQQHCQHPESGWFNIAGGEQG